MPNRRIFQVHANVNSDYGDSAMRVTITEYDEQGASVSHHTWRGHVKTLDFEGQDWQAYGAVIDLAKMMANACNSGDEIAELDVPLF